MTSEPPVGMTLGMASSSVRCGGRPNPRSNRTQTKFSAASSQSVRLNPICGASKNVLTSVPPTAPAVFSAYSRPTCRPSPTQAVKTRSAAGSVAPMASVAGASRTKVPPKASNAWRAADGSAPISVGRICPESGMSMVSASAQSPIRPSMPAYQAAGLGLPAMRRDSASAPRPRPTKNAASTASTETISCPSETVSIFTQTIS